jgi:hypothetical protein
MCHQQTFLTPDGSAFVAVVDSLAILKVILSQLCRSKLSSALTWLLLSTTAIFLS